MFSLPTLHAVWVSTDPDHDVSFVELLVPADADGPRRLAVVVHLRTLGYVGPVL